MYVLYTDDSIIAAPTDEELDDVIVEMKQIGLDLTVEGFLEDFLGVHIEINADGTIEMSQRRLIDSIIEEVFGSDQLPSPKDIPIASTVG